MKLPAHWQSAEVLAVPANLRHYVTAYAEAFAKEALAQQAAAGTQRDVRRLVDAAQQLSSVLPKDSSPNFPTYFARCQVTALRTALKDIKL